jgi:hypothetical protein
MSTSDTSKSAKNSINKLAKKIADNIPDKLAKKIIGKSKSNKKSDKKFKLSSPKFKQSPINQDKKKLPLNIMSLDMRDLITYTLKAYIDITSDI